VGNTSALEAYFMSINLNLVSIACVLLIIHLLFNLTMQNKIDHANRILRLMDRYPDMTVEELFYWIACRIEGEKFVVSSYRWSVPMLQETYDNRDNLERLQYLVWDAGGKVQWED
jgi:hypothetical protein